jgi:phosphoribosylamine--glycine ligase
MNVLVVGSGAREHALAWKFGQSSRLDDLHVTPGNAGMAQFATCHDVDATDIDGIVALAQEIKADLVVVGPEAPLVAGLSNRLKKYGIPCFGPSAMGARIEGSKVFAKELMDRSQVPTARWEAFSDVQAALAAINRWRGPVVIKADGLTGGRGAYICMTKVQAERALTQLLVESSFGVSGRRVVVEEFLQGIEASITVLTDGENVVPLPVVRAVRRREDGNTGPNTDGMGAWLPADDLFEQQIEEAIDAGIRPALADMKARGTAFCGALYADVMFTKSGPKILEFNCRLGEIETPAMVRAMDEDLLDLFYKTAVGELAGVTLAEPAGAAVSIALVDSTYPATESSDTHFAIAGVNDAAEIEDIEVFVGSSALVGKGKTQSLVSLGGRALTVTAVGDTLEDAVATANAACDAISFEGMHRRTDVAADALMLV